MWQFAEIGCCWGQESLARERTNFVSFCVNVCGQKAICWNSPAFYSVSLAPSSRHGAWWCHNRVFFMLQTPGLKVFNRPVNHLVEKLTTKQQCWQPDLVPVVTPAIRHSCQLFSLFQAADWFMSTNEGFWLADMGPLTNMVCGSGRSVKCR